MIDRIKRLIKPSKAPEDFCFRLIIETVASCNLSCTMCPTAYYGPSHKGLMHERIFQKALSLVQENMQVILTGWGEPLVDSRLEEHVRLCKEVGATVYIATNATLLVPDRARGLLDAGLDGLSVSLDAGLPKTYSRIRGGNFHNVIQNMASLARLREKINTKFWIDVSFVTMQLNFSEMAPFLKLVSDIGVNSATITPRYLIFSGEDFSRHFVPVDEVMNAFQDAQGKVSTGSMELRTYALENFPQGDCLAEAVKTAFISFKGQVSACCNLGHPAPRYLPSTGKSMNPFTIFGNIENQDFEHIWSSKKFSKFRKSLSQGMIPRPCKGCLLVSTRDQAPVAIVAK
jgi:MoaA/NifB/PqqE/SkfB family radical SAM enzyme